MQPTPIAVLGGAGRTGHFLLTHLLAAGYHIRALVRHPEQFHFTHASLEVIQGDALDANAIAQLLTGCSAVLSTIGQRQGEPMVASQLMKLLPAAMHVAGINRYIALAGVNVTALGDQKGLAAQQATAWMQTNFPEIHADRQISFDLLQASALSWTMVRVPFIYFEEGDGQLLVQLHDCPAQQVMAGDIARFMVKTLQENSYLRQAPFVGSKPA